MKHKLPTWLFGLSLAVLTPVTADETKQPGAALLREAVQQLRSVGSFQATLAQRVDMYGQQLVGSGTYYQAGRGDGVRLRLELKLQVAQQTATIQQVCDGRFLWLRRDLGGPQAKQLSRVDLQRVRDEVRKPTEKLTGETTANWLAIGGLPKLLEQLEQTYDFGDARADTQNQTPVWVLEGRWKPESLARLFPEHKSPSVDRLPPHIPHGVTVVLARDATQPLFPQRIEYGRTTSDGNGSHWQPTMTLQILDIRRTELDPRLFQYEPSDEEIAKLTDYTDVYLKTLGLK